MKSILKLKIACVLIWTGVLGLCTLGSLQIKNDKKVMEVTEITPVSQIAENNNFINVINGNNNKTRIYWI